MKIRRIVRGEIVTFAAPDRCTHIPKGAVAIDAAGRIAWMGARSRLPAAMSRAPVDDYGDGLVLPGLIDAHIHFPQYRILAAPGKDLLDWLHRFTFPEEARFARRAVAAPAARTFLETLWANGTTAAMVFCSSHRLCADVLFTEAARHDMAIVTGKTMMDRNAIPAIEDTPEASARDSDALLRKWHGRGRARYAISPRFAITSTEAQLRLAGELLKDHPEALMQTHLSESQLEIETVARLFPNDRDYVSVYDRFGLLGPTSRFAHAVHLSERECARLHETGSAVVHCPTSNTFLGSGLFRIAHLADPRRPVPVGIATDIGGGTSYSMLATLGESYKVAMLSGSRPRAVELFHRATRGNAELLGIATETGSLEPGFHADIVVLDPEATPVLARRHAMSQSLEDVLFALALLGDDRAVAATYVAGKRVHRRTGRR